MMDEEGPRVMLEDRPLWENFNGLTNEMIVTKSGRYETINQNFLLQIIYS